MALPTFLLAIIMAAPASAAPALPPCGGIGFGSHDTAVSPDFTPVLGAVDHSFTIDLSDQEVAEGEEPIRKADVNVLLSWSGSPVSDYDMTVNGTDVWNNPIPPENSETFLLEDVLHCETVDVTVWTYIGTPIDTVTLTLGVSA
jgi:hypothetical protein